MAHPSFPGQQIDKLRARAEAAEEALRTEAALRAEVLGSDPDNNLDIRVATFIEERERPLRDALRAAWKQLYAVATLATVPESVDWAMVVEDCMDAANAAEAALKPTQTSEED